MVRLRNMRQLAYVCSILMLCVYVAPVGQALAAGEPDPALVKQKVVVFPFAVADEITQKQMGQDMAVTLADVLKNTGAYEVLMFSKRHPSVQRAVVVENSLKQTDLLDAYGENNRDLAIKIGREMGGDLVIIGDIDSYRRDATKNSCEVVVNVDLVDVNTGKSEKRAAVPGRTPEGSKAMSEQECVAIAAGNAVTRIIEELGVKTVSVGTEAIVGQKKKKSSKRNTLLISLVLALGLGLALSGGSGGGNGGGADPPPPPP